MRARFGQQSVFYSENSDEIPEAKKTFEPMKTICGFEFIHESDSGSGGKNSSLRGKIGKFFPT